MNARMRTVPFILGVLLLTIPCSGFTAQPVAVQAYETRTIRVPGTTVSFELIRCPPAEEDERPLWTLRTEVPWELYDIFVYGLDQPDDDPDADHADAVARPSKPYVPPDRGFGHQGYPAMGMTRHAAEQFCVWLSEVTGTAFRLPTASEWTHLAADGENPEHAGENNAWTLENAEYSTHPVGRKHPNAYGLHDMLGNVAEWVLTDTRRPRAMGGSYRHPQEDCHPTHSIEQDSSWNASDPQIPKSRWWLADCSWVGFRILTQDDIAQETPDDE